MKSYKGHHLHLLNGNHGSDLNNEKYINNSKSSSNSLIILRKVNRSKDHAFLLPILVRGLFISLRSQRPPEPVPIHEQHNLNQEPLSSHSCWAVAIGQPSFSCDFSLLSASGVSGFLVTFLVALGGSEQPHALNKEHLQRHIYIYIYIYIYDVFKIY